MYYYRPDKNLYYFVTHDYKFYYFRRDHIRWEKSVEFRGKSDMDKRAWFKTPAILPNWLPKHPGADIIKKLIRLF